MARVHTLLELRDKVLDETQIAGQGDVGAAVVTAAINRSVAWHWHELIAAGEGYGESQVAVVATPNVSTIDYPTGRLQIRSLLRPTSGTSAGYVRASHLQRPTYADQVGPVYDDAAVVPLPGIYWYESALASLGTPPNPPDPIVDLIHLRPTPVVAEQIRIIAIEEPPVLAEDTDQLRVDPGWEHAICSYAAYLLLRSKDASLAGQFRRDAEEGMQRTMRAWRNQRDQGGPDSVYKFRRPSRYGRRFDWL